MQSALSISVRIKEFNATNSLELFYGWPSAMKPWESPRTADEWATEPKSYATPEDIRKFGRNSLRDLVLNLNPPLKKKKM